jgi:HSP20 family molecular chaperone IbpA
MDIAVNDRGSGSLSLLEIEKLENRNVVNLQRRENGFPMKILEDKDYFAVEALMTGFAAEEISVCLTSRIITITTWPLDRKDEGDQDRRKRNAALYLRTSIDPKLSIAHFSRGLLYLKMFKDPSPKVHRAVCLQIKD